MRVTVLALTVSGLAASLVFVVRFLFTSWWRTEPGRQMMLFHVIVLLTFCAAVVGQAWPDLPPFPWVRVVVASALNIALWGHVAVLFRVQRSNKGSNRG
jgi:hypothetical protein